MLTLTDINSNLNEIPRFDDGMINISETMRLITQATVNEIMDIQADMLCENTDNTRNGYRERKLITCVGTITLRIPKLRIGTYFPEDMIVRYSRTDRALIAAIVEMVVNGVSTRKVERVAKEMGIEKMSASQVSRMCASLDETVADLQKREFKDLNFPYLWLDATYVKARHEGKVTSTAMVTAIALGSDGYRRVVGLKAVDTESYMSWLGFLRSLRERGIEGVMCITSDAHAGLKRAIEEIYPGCAWQRCIVHLIRNCASLAHTKRKRIAITKILSAVFEERDANLVRELYHQACIEIAKICPAAGKLLEEAEPDALAYLDFPYAHHTRLRTNNVQERMNREIKRRSRVVQVFPSRKSLIRYIGATLAELDEKWMERRWFSIDSVSEVLEKPKPAPAPTYEGTAAEHARNIIKFVLEKYGKVA